MTYLIHDIKINLNLPEEIDIILLRTHVPEIKKIKSENSLYSINFFDSNISEIKSKDKEINLYGKWSKSIYNDIPHLLYSFFRKIMLEKGYFLLHSIMIEDSLFIGHSGQGKTTLALKARSENKEIGSYNKTLIKEKDGVITKILGTDVISQRDGSKEEVVLSEITNIKNIFLFSYSDKKMIKRLSGKNLLHQLYPFLMDFIKTDCIVDGNIYSGSIKIDKIDFDFNNVFVITGNYDDILKGIEI